MSLVPSQPTSQWDRGQENQCKPGGKLRAGRGPEWGLLLPAGGPAKLDGQTSGASPWQLRLREHSGSLGHALQTGRGIPYPGQTRKRPKALRP